MLKSPPEIWTQSRSKRDAERGTKWEVNDASEMQRRRQTGRSKEEGAFGRPKNIAQNTSPRLTTLDLIIHFYGRQVTPWEVRLALSMNYLVFIPSPY